MKSQIFTMLSILLFFPSSVYSQKLVKVGGCTPQILDIWVDKDGNQQKHGTLQKCSKDGRLQVRVTYVKGKLHGTATVFHSRNLRFMAKESNWKHGKLHGITRRWHSNGKIEKAESYLDGKKHGFSKYYSYQGIIEKKVHYKNGKKHGFATKYDSKGRRTIKASFKNGIIDGYVYKFDGKTGVLTSQVFVIAADKVATLYEWSDSKSNKCFRSLIRSGRTVHKFPCVKKRPVVK